MLRLLLSLVLISRAGQAAQIEQLVNNGPDETRLNLVLFSEGYTEAEFDKFTADSNAFVDALFSQFPFSEYSSYFNIYIIKVASNESGSDHPDSDVFKDTFFNSTFDSYGIARLISIPPNDVDDNPENGVSKIEDLLIDLLPTYDVGMMLVNDPELGGSGGGLAIASINPASSEIMLHELGHVLAALGDEYDTPTAGSFNGGAEDPNTTRSRTLQSIKWNAWIDSDVPVPTPLTVSFQDRVGLFQGARYDRRFWYRPKLNCLMRTLGEPFCEVCSEALIRSIYSLVSPIEKTIPEVAELTIPKDPNITFEVFLKEPTSHRLKIQWTLNETPIEGANSTKLSLTSQSLVGNEATVGVMITDEIAAVRTDPDQLLQDQFIWNIQFEDAPQSIEIQGLTLLSTGEFQFKIPASKASTLYIESSDDLKQWLRIWTNRQPNQGFTFLENLPTSQSSKFFRAVSQ